MATRVQVDRRMWIATTLVCALGIACDPGEANDEDFSESMEEGDGNLGKADDANGGESVSEPGQLRWSQMAGLQGAAEGLPLFVSNNPEHVEGYGILAGVPYPGLSLAGAQRAPGAPQAQWSREIIDSRCSDGGMQEFGVYIAHILPGNLGDGRRLTLALVAQDDVEIKVRGSMGSTDWSENGNLLTTRTDWLGAELAKDFFFRTDLATKTYNAKAGEMVEIASELALSLVEGRFHVEANGCVHPFTIAHSAGLGGVMPGHYAPGDVKWPGWFEGAGFGRAAGVYDGDQWNGEQTVTIRESKSVQGVGMLTANDSNDALARHEDSAEILFGNYGVLYEQTLNLDNQSGQCVDVNVDFVSYIDRKNSSERTPTVQFFRDTAGDDPPSMFWNGPVEAEIKDVSKLLYHPVLSYAPTAAEEANPNLAMGSMRETIATLELQAGADKEVTVRFPVPGYIVAPIALTVQSQPCG
ncbi:MAG: DUF3370 family protein [Myxococcota bacterium]